MEKMNLFGDTVNNEKTNNTIIEKIEDSINRDVIPNGLVKVLFGNTELELTDILEKVKTIITNKDVSDLTFDTIDLSNDIKTIEDFEKVLLTDGVVYREYVDSCDAHAGLVFGDGKCLNNFRWYGFQYSGDMDGCGDCGSFYVHTLNDMTIVKCSKEVKLELLRYYLKACDVNRFVKYEDELNKYLDWFVDNFMCKGRYVVDGMEHELNYSRMSFSDTYPIGKVPSPVDGYMWKSLGETELGGHKYDEYEIEMPVVVRDGALYIGDSKMLSKDATELLVFLGRQSEQLSTILISKYPQFKYFPRWVK